MMLYELPFTYKGSVDDVGKASGWGKAMLSEDFVISGTFHEDHPHGLCKLNLDHFIVNYYRSNEENIVRV